MAFLTPTTVATVPTDGTNPKVFTYNGVVGRQYVLCLGRYLAADSFTSVVDNGGNTWARIAAAPLSGTTGRRIEIWHCKPTAPFTAVTATQNNTGFGTGALIELQGGSGVVNVAAAIERASSTTPAALNITPTKAKTMIIACIQANTNTTSQITPSAGWTNLTSQVEGPEIVYKYDSPANTATGVSWTLVSGTGSGHAIAAFEEGSAFSMWNGTTEVPLFLEGYWNGTTIVPLTFDEIYDGSEDPPAPTLLVGLDCLPGNTAADFTAFPYVAYHRDFGNDGGDADTLPEFSLYGSNARWTNLAALGHPDGAVMHVSAKDDASQFSAVLDSIPDTPPAWFKGIYASPWHEPEDDVRDGTITAAKIRADGLTMTNIKNSHPKGHWVLGVGPILTRFDLDPDGPIDTDPADYGWAGMDFYGFDSYQSSTSGGYYDNQKMFGDVIDKIHSVYPNIPILIPEYGLVKQTADTTGSARAAAITSHIAYLRSRGDVLAIAYFNEIGSIPGVPLDDTPSADAWRAAQASQ